MRRLGAGEPGASSSPTGRAPATTRRRGCCGRSRSACPSSRSRRGSVGGRDPRRDRRRRDRRRARPLRPAHRRRRGAAAPPRGAGRARPPTTRWPARSGAGRLRDAALLLHPRDANPGHYDAIFGLLRDAGRRAPHRASRPPLRSRPDAGARRGRVRDRRESTRVGVPADLTWVRSLRAPRSPSPARAAARPHAGRGAPAGRRGGCRGRARVALPSGGHAAAR